MIVYSYKIFIIFVSYYAITTLPYKNRYYTINEFVD